MALGVSLDLRLAVEINSIPFLLVLNAAHYVRQQPIEATGSIAADLSTVANSIIVANLGCGEARALHVFGCRSSPARIGPCTIGQTSYTLWNRD